MRAIQIEQGTNRLYVGQYEDPHMNEDDLLIAVKTTALNRADLLQKKGLYPPPEGASSVLGLEMAGVVEAVGRNVEGWQPGDRVFALLPGGGYAEKVVVPKNMAMKLPDHFSFQEGAAIPEAFLTAYLNLVVLGKAKQGETVLIHAGASGVGTAAIQLAKAIGLNVFVTAGSEEKLALCRSLGADTAIDYKSEEFGEVILRETSDQGVDVIFDFIGASYWDQNMKSIGRDGRWIVIGLLGGNKTMINMGDILQKRVSIIGSTLRSRTPVFKGELTQQFADFALDKFQSGELKPVIDRVFDWEDAEAAHQYMENNKNAGKIILQIDDK